MVTTMFDKPMGIGQIKLHQTGSAPLECDSVPLLPGNGCTDGAVYAMTGINVGTDSTLTCADNTECGIAQICDGGICVPEPCTVDADCDQDGTGNGGSGECGPGNECCDPDITPGCAAYIP